MTKTKRQLRAEAVERLRSIPNERMNATSVVVAIAGEAAYRLGGTRDARDMCIDLLTDDDSTIAETESTTESLSDGADSREKLEADVLKYYTHTVSTAMWPPSANKHTDMVSVSMDDVLGWLDRQAAITANETNHDNPYVGLVRGKQWERTEKSDYYCGRCGWKVTDHDSYCPECGGALHKTSNKPDSKFDVPKSGKTTENSTAKNEIRDFDDTRKKLEYDVKEICWGKNDNRYFAQKCYLSSYSIEVDEGNVMANHEGHVLMTVIMHLLDRQDAITRRECDKSNWDYCETCELTAEHDQLINAINELQKKQPYCYNPEQQLDTLNTIGRYINELIAERDELRDELAATKKHLKVAQGQLSVTLNNWEQAKGNLRRQKEALDLRAVKLDDRDAKTADEIAAEEIDRWKAKAEKARDDAETWRKACGDVLDAADEIHRIMSFHFPSGVR